tara:strand:- start:591 stop:923 length:333 start_codon:yes stop_codon:yes gene_type:complete
MVAPATYCYWSNSLRTSFDLDVYNWFRYEAMNDARTGDMYGMQCLFRFYSYGLEKNFKSGIFQDFQEYVLMDCEAGNTYGIEKLWAFMHYSKRRPEVMPSIKEYLVRWLV